MNWKTEDNGRRGVAIPDYLSEYQGSKQVSQARPTSAKREESGELDKVSRYAQFTKPFLFFCESAWVWLARL